MRSASINERSFRCVLDPRLPRKVLATAVLSLTFFFGVGEAKSQDFPPPLKTISDSDRRVLESAPNSSERLKRATMMMNARLAAAESAVASGDEMRMFFELGAFQGLMEDTLKTLLDYDGMKRTSSQILNLKRFEVTVRGFPPRIEMIRRKTYDLEFDAYISDLQVKIRDTRSRALDPMFVRP